MARKEDHLLALEVLQHLQVEVVRLPKVIYLVLLQDKEFLQLLQHHQDLGLLQHFQEVEVFQHLEARLLLKQEVVHLPKVTYLVLHQDRMVLLLKVTYLAIHKELKHHLALHDKMIDLNKWVLARVLAWLQVWVPLALWVTQ